MCWVNRARIFHMLAALNIFTVGCAKENRSDVPLLRAAKVESAQEKNEVPIEVVYHRKDDSLLKTSVAPAPLLPPPVVETPAIVDVPSPSLPPVAGPVGAIPVVVPVGGEEFHSDDDQQHDDDELRLSDLNGSYAYEQSGDFGLDPTTNQLVNHITEVGVFEADGNGNITATATAIYFFVDNPLTNVANDAATITSAVSYTCTYDIPTGQQIFLVTCSKRKDDHLGTFSNLKFDLSLGQETGIVQIQALPLSGTPFENLSIVGTAAK